MTSSTSTGILSRLSDEEFIGREADLARLRAIARPRRANSVSRALVLGGRRVGKSELLRKTFDRLFIEAGGLVPFYFAVTRSHLDPAAFAHDYFTQVLAQLVAFRRNDPRLIFAADEPLGILARTAPAGDYSWVKAIVNTFSSAIESGQTDLLLRRALGAPAAVWEHCNLRPFVMIDNWHLLEVTVHSQFINVLSGQSPLSPACSSYALCGRQRQIVKLIPADAEIAGTLDLIRVEPLSDDSIETLIRRRAEREGIEITDSTAEVMIQQLNRDPFYVSAIIDAAASKGSLKTFIDFERIYATEVTSGRMAFYFDALIRDAAGDARSQRAALEALALVIEAETATPLEILTERIGEHTSESGALLARLHSHELLDLTQRWATAVGDPVLCDYVRTRYRHEIVGAPRPVAGSELLAEKLKDSYRLMMSRYSRAVESQLIEVLSRFDFQNVPASLFDQFAFDKRYRGMSRVLIRRALDGEVERVRLPQIVLVGDLGSGEQPGVKWRLFAALGFEAGIYTGENEVLWQVALITSRDPIDVETLSRVDQHIESALRNEEGESAARHSIRWYISKEGFSAVALERLSDAHAYRSTVSHLDLIQDYLARLALGGKPRPASEFELVIPTEDEAELIAARTVEQIARAADFSAEAINQIKTALIEACINAAEHGDTPDKKIYQRFAIDEDKLIITVSNKGARFGRTNGQPSPSVAEQSANRARGRGLQIIRTLMDEVEFERTDDGARLVMTKYLKRPGSQ